MQRLLRLLRANGRCYQVTFILIIISFVIFGLFARYWPAARWTAHFVNDTPSPDDLPRIYDQRMTLHHEGTSRLATNLKLQGILVAISIMFLGRHIGTSSTITLFGSPI